MPAVSEVGTMRDPVGWESWVACGASILLHRSLECLKRRARVER